MNIIENIDRLVARLRTRHWKPPEIVCGSCKELLDRKIVHHTGDGWLWAWECPNYCGFVEDDAFIKEWPWLRNYVWGKDWEALGFEVV
jgi:hypothetical protein